MRLLLAIACFAFALNADAVDLVLQSGFVDSGGERIYYETVGQGEAVVFSHGLGGNHVIWYQQVPEFAKDYKVITWDQRGFGRSTNVQGKATPVVAAEDLKALLDHLNIEKAHVIGQSMGGWAVLGFALNHPDRVHSVIMADTIGGIYNEEIAKYFDMYIRKAMSSPPPDKQPITRHPALGEGIEETDPAQAFLYRQVQSLAAAPPTNMGLLLRQTAYPIEDIRLFGRPILFIVGEHDPIFPPPMIRAAANEMHHADVVQLPSAGHSPYFETPEAWNETVLNFLRRNGK